MTRQGYGEERTEACVVAAEIAHLSDGVSEPSDYEYRASPGPVVFSKILSVQEVTPTVVWIDGNDRSGRRIHLIQHISQLSFLMAPKAK